MFQREVDAVLTSITWQSVLVYINSNNGICFSRRPDGHFHLVLLWLTLFQEAGEIRDLKKSERVTNYIDSSDMSFSLGSWTVDTNNWSYAQIWIPKPCYWTPIIYGFMNFILALFTRICPCGHSAASEASWRSSSSIHICWTKGSRRITIEVLEANLVVSLVLDLPVCQVHILSTPTHVSSRLDVSVCKGSWENQRANQVLVLFCDKCRAHHSTRPSWKGCSGRGSLGAPGLPWVAWVYSLVWSLCV